MFKYRVYDKSVGKFKNVFFKDMVENLTKIEKREFKAMFANDPEHPHILRIISGPVEVEKWK